MSPCHRDWPEIGNFQLDKKSNEAWPGSGHVWQASAGMTHEFSHCQPGGDTCSFFCDSGEQLEILNFLPHNQDLGLTECLSRNAEAPKGACQCHCIEPARNARASGTGPSAATALSRKFRISYCSQAEQKKEQVSPPGVRVTNPSLEASPQPAPQPESPAIYIFVAFAL